MHIIKNLKYFVSRTLKFLFYSIKFIQNKIEILKKFYFYYLFRTLSLFICFFVSSQAFSAEFCGESFDFEEIEKQLSTENIISKVCMEDFLLSKGHIAHFTSEVYLVKLATGIQAVLKLVDTSWPRDAVAEVAAYKASQFLGIHLVPPTVLYTREGLVGSLQYYVEPSFDLMLEDKYEEVKKRVSSNDLANIELFYFIFGQWDPDPSNLIAVEAKDRAHFALIDNAAIGYTQKTRYGDYPFVLCFPDTIFPIKTSLEAFPFDDVRLLPPDIKIWQTEFGTILSKSQIKQICQLQWSPVVFVIWNGHFWRQYRFGSPSHTDFYPMKSMEKIRELSYEKLQEFYNNELELVFDDEYFNEIMERRDQVIERSNISA